MYPAYIFLPNVNNGSTPNEKENPSGYVSIKEIRSLIKNLLKQKAPASHGFTGEFYQNLKEKIIPLRNNLFGGQKQIAPQGQHYPNTKTKTLQDKKIADQYLSSTLMQKFSTKY